MSSTRAGIHPDPRFSRGPSEQARPESDIRLRLVADEGVALQQVASVIGLDRSSTYRRSRKYTALKLAELARDGIAELRAAIGSTANGPLLAWELITFLFAQEQTIPAWKLKKLPPLDGVPRRRGRPRKRPPTSW